MHAHAPFGPAAQEASPPFNVTKKPGEALVFLVDRGPRELARERWQASHMGLT